jgi:cation diffusion facilitator family transporter
MKKQYSNIKIGMTETILSIVINTMLFILKMIAGSASGSIAMIADAWHTLSDTATSLVAMAGLYMCAKKPDDVHPFGHGRAENI